MDIDRNDELQNDDSNNITPEQESENNKDSTSKGPHFTEVKNAHASGMGSMGRSDEKIKDNDKSAEEDKSVY